MDTSVMGQLRRRRSAGQTPHPNPLPFRRGEGEVSAVSGSPRRLPFLKAPPRTLPLPIRWGEGRGEGSARDSDAAFTETLRTTRRDFIRTLFGASAVAAFSPAVPAFLARTALAAGAQGAARDSVLVVVQLSGGNDGLNTVVPYEDDAYRRSRPTLRLGGQSVLKLGSGLGLHPEMPAFLRLYQEGHLDILQGVGYPDSDRDHQVAMRNWHTARPGEALAQTGWVGRAIDWACNDGQTDVPGVFVGPIPAPFGLQSARAVVPAIKSLDSWLPADRAAAVRSAVEAASSRAGASAEASSNPLPDFLRRTALEAAVASTRLEAARQAATQTGAAPYPGFSLAQTLKSCALLIRAELGIRIFFAEMGGGGIGGFDTHADQAANHGALLRELSESVAAFFDDLQRNRLLARVRLMTFSEFGRTLSENGRRGTGHGAAAPLFLAGGGLKGGLIGQHPSLTDLDADAPKFHTDFRRVYATVLDRWLGFNSQAVLGARFQPLDSV